jgi:hypothetical protein
MAKQRKQVSLDFIDHTKRTINDLLASKIPQSAKQKLCIVMEKLLRDMKQSENDFQYLYWNKYGKLDWNSEKDQYLSKLALGSAIKIPKQYVTGPEDTGSPDFVSDIQGEFSRHYK